MSSTRFDPERAIRFYSELFQWEISKWEGPIDYWTIKTGPEDQKGINGGMIRRQGTLDGEAVIAYVCTISVSSVDATVSAVEQNGGQVVVQGRPAAYGDPVQREIPRNQARDS